ncbi:MAG: hypothetical protein KAT62_02015 [Desulfuromonadales bacterium]|nr:hypothetical protein [Chloroflexota bacterium]MCK4620970.1 hypothetical protein [Desulfuromonadales bacterium]MCK4691403.1 hypothetical protein [Desulfuromonadales bacterium]
MIKLLILVLLGFVGYSIIQGLIRPKDSRGRKMPRSRSQEGEQMVEDPQCGTFLPLSDAISANINGRQQYFCSRKCLKEYKKNH